ncbi:MAG TPA: hypothetical protein PK050_13580, partial [Hyphomonadaceae bacterium]|nr:hypothetical protein [Hyphomonadaceae bacterium]
MSRRTFSWLMLTAIGARAISGGRTVEAGSSDFHFGHGVAFPLMWSAGRVGLVKAWGEGGPRVRRHPREDAQPPPS